MFNFARSNNSLPDNGNTTHDVSSHGAQLPVENSDNNSWQTVHFPGTVIIDEIPGTNPNLQTNAMDSSSTLPGNSISETTTEQTGHQREAELLNLVRDLNECNDVLLAKVSQLEESLERSQAALQAEIDRAPDVNRVGDREIVQLVTELEQSNQSLQHHQMLNETLQTELAAYRERTAQLEAEHKALLRQNTEQSQELLQANTNCRDLRARLQRQQRYTLQFKAALEKCLSMSTESSNSSVAPLDVSNLTMPKAEEIRPWESALGHGKLDPQLESLIRGAQGNPQVTVQPPEVTLDAQRVEIRLETEAEDQLWHDLARVMDPDEVAPEAEGQALTMEDKESSPQAPQFTEPSQFTEPLEFTEPSPWAKEPQETNDSVVADSLEDATTVSAQLSPQASEILARVQASRTAALTDTYLPAMSAQGSPSPLVNPLKPQKRITSLSAIDLPNFPRLKKQPPAAQT